MSTSNSSFLVNFIMNDFFFFIEYLWTFIPFILIALIIMPFFVFTTSQFSTFNFLAQISSVFPVFINANQWFWDFYIFDCSFPSVEFISFLNFYNFLTLTSIDVIHAFHLPFFFIKSDCVPGLLSNLYFCSSLNGVFHGYCAQICGQQHSLMCFSFYVI